MIGYLLFFCISNKEPVQPLQSSSHLEKELNSCIQELQRIKSLPEKDEHRSVNVPATRSVLTIPESDIPSAPQDSASEKPVSQIEWRISAIDKLVNLSDSEKEQLRAKYQNPHEPNQRSLEDIIGPDRARTYQDFVAQTFSKAQEEGIQKEVYYLSRKLGLDPLQESRIFDLYRGLNEEVTRKLEELGNKEKGVQRMMKESELSDQILREKLKSTFSATQYEAWLLLQADSTDRDLELFHSAPEKSEGKKED